MSDTHLELPGSDRAVLRESVTAIDSQISRLSTLSTVEEYRAAADELIASFSGLVKLLALGQAAELRACPTCKKLGMRAATRCGYCWAELSPLAAPQDSSAAPPASAGHT